MPSGGQQEFQQPEQRRLGSPDVCQGIKAKGYDLQPVAKTEEIPAQNEYASVITVPI